MGGERLSDRANGRWRGLLPALGVDARYLSGKHTGCPICRAGKDRFRFDDKRGAGSFICSQCGAGNGIDLAMKVNGWDFKETATRIEGLIGTVPYVAPPRERSDAEKREGLRRLWKGTRRVRSDDAVGRWLYQRVGLTAVPSSLRFHPSALSLDGESKTWHPAMIALLIGSNDVPAILHRTFLKADGTKADVVKVRSMMPGTIPAGCAVRLFPPAEVMGIGEGIETSLAAASLFGLPVWAATNAVILSKWVPPAEARSITVFGDNDANHAGQEAAAKLAGRLLVAGFKVEVRIPDRIPERTKTDWNDVYLQREVI